MTNGKQTEFLLKSISQRLASREDCKDTSYNVTINSTGIHMVPIVYVFPDRYHRKDSDKTDVVSFIKHTKLFDTGLDEFVFGSYEYSLIDNEKKRKWRKVD